MMKGQCHSENNRHNIVTFHFTRSRNLVLCKQDIICGILNLRYIEISKLLLTFLQSNIRILILLVLSRASLFVFFL